MEILDVSALVANIATFLGIPYAILLFMRERNRDRVERQVATYSTLTEKYIDYLKLCLENSDLPVWDDESPPPPGLSEEATVKTLIILEILTNVFEMAYFLYQDESDEFKRAQWDGWSQYVENWCRRTDYREAWKEWLRDQYDANFRAYVDKVVERVEQRALSSAPGN